MSQKPSNDKNLLESQSQLVECVLIYAVSASSTLELTDIGRILNSQQVRFNSS